MQDTVTKTDEDRALSYINFLTHYCNNCPMSIL